MKMMFSINKRVIPINSENTNYKNNNNNKIFLETKLNTLENSINLRYSMLGRIQNASNCSNCDK